MYTLKVKNHRGEVLDLSTNRNYTVYKIEGLQPPAVNINTSKNASSDGATLNGMSVDQRNIVIYVALEGNVEKSRIDLYKYFPLKKTITLYYKNDTRDVYIEGNVELIECDFFTSKQVAQISIICPEPYFKGVNELITYFSDITGVFEFPFSIPETGVEVSTLIRNVRKSIINTGDVESGIIISIYALGSVVNPIIYDAIERTYIGLNFTMRTNDLITISTGINKKAITLLRDGVTTNLIGHLNPASSWLTLEPGDNVFTYDADEGAVNMQITFNTPILYGGV